MGKTIGIVSLKGGVGKTSVVTALGGALSRLGKKVLLVDGNLSSPSLGLHLNVIEPEKTLHDVLNRNARLREAVYSSGNLDVIPASIFKEIEVNPLKLKDHLNSIKKRYDVIILDSSPSLDDETLAVILASDEVFVVTTPDHPTMSASLKAAKLAKQRGTPISGIILNKVHNKDFELSLKDIEGTLDIPVLAVIPYDTNILRALSNMEPSTTFKPNSKGSEEFMKFAATITGEKYESKGIMNFFRGMVPTKPEINREIFYNSAFR
ncbi:MAG: AAA family ATPase [Candidatus Pacearchaeota archaeon]|nr:AAA family ATPase [Candidatus Pacearchaeota archaeon]